MDVWNFLILPFSNCVKDSGNMNLEHDSIGRCRTAASRTIDFKPIIRHTAYPIVDEAVGLTTTQAGFRARFNTERHAPSSSILAWELPRVLTEVSRLGLTWPLLLGQAPRGDGHAVMVLPGFLGGDDSTVILRQFLTRLGYVTLPWLHGRNVGKLHQVEGALMRFYRAHHKSGEKISLVGQSLGGIYAREIARRLPQATRCVITLGSPFAGADAEHMANSLVRRLFERLSGHTAQEMRDHMFDQDDPRAPLGMPSTAIYSKTDGVAAWMACVDRESRLAENVEVRASHVGMAMNPDVLHVIADRLAQDPDDWRRFERKKGCRSWIYPEPASA